MYNYKKTISPVVATALLLVVVVVSVVGFQTWFGIFSSNMFSKTQIQSNDATDGTLGIETLIGNILYIKNGISDNLTINSLKIGGTICNLTNQVNLSLGMNEINVTSCVSNLSTNTPNIVLITNNKIIDKQVYIKEKITSVTPVLNCSNLGLIGGEWVTVSGNPTLGTVDFCVMKFEAKFVNYSGKSNTDNFNTWNFGTAIGDKNITSIGIGGPIAYINQSNAEVACQSLGANYHLISDPQWVTIAREAELNFLNWNTNEVYSGSMMRGHSDSIPNQALSVTNVNDGYNGTGQSVPSIERRSLYLQNNETIFDIGGNVWEWTADTLPTSGVLNSSLGMGTGQFFVQWNTIPSNYNYLKALNASLTSTNGIGQGYYDGDTAFPSGDFHGFLRGGDWLGGSVAGAFCLDVGAAPSHSSSYGIGFRCVYNL